MLDGDRPWEGPGAVLLIASCAFTLLALFFLSYLTDDTYIYLQYARHLAAGQGFCFNAGEITYGFTSPLWLLLIAMSGKLGIGGLASAKLLGFLFSLLSLVVFFRAATMFIPTPAGRTGAILAWAVNAWLLRWSLSGMETSLCVFLVVAGIAAHMRERRDGGAPRASALLFGLASLARPECLLLVLLALLDAALAGGRPGRRRSILAVLLWSGVVLLPWWLVAYRTFGHLLPNTAAAKGGSFGLGIAASLRTLRQEALIVGATDLADGMLALLGGIAIARRIPRDATFRAGVLPVAWLIGLPLLYALRGIVTVSRYLVPILPVLILSGFAALDSLRARTGLAGRAPRLAAALPWIVLGLMAAQNLLVLFFVQLPSTKEFTRSFERSLVEIARLLHDEAPQAASVATADIGAIGYFSERRVVDLFGLVTPAMLPYHRTETLDGVVEKLRFAEVDRPDFLVDRFTAPDRFAAVGRWPGVMEPILSRKVGRLTLRRGDQYYYTLYRIHWDRYQALRETGGGRP